MRILIVDDDLQIRRALRFLLEREGYEVLEAGDGKQGMNLYGQDPTDLVITDLVMPEKGGIELIQEMLNDFPEAKIIAITGGGLVPPEKLLASADRLGILAGIQKPFAAGDVLDTVRKVLET